MRALEAGGRLTATMAIEPTGNIPNSGGVMVLFPDRVPSRQRCAAREALPAFYAAFPLSFAGSSFAASSVFFSCLLGFHSSKPFIGRPMNRRVAVETAHQGENEGQDSHLPAITQATIENVFRKG